MKKIIAVCLVIVIFFLCSCKIPQISININYGEDLTSSENSVITTQTAPLPVETACPHKFSKGYCIYCGSSDPSYPYFAFDFMANYLQKNGTFHSTYYGMTVYKKEDSSLMISYDTSKNTYTLAYSTGEMFNMFIELDRIGNCSYLGAVESNGSVLCMGSGKIDVRTYTFSTVVTLGEYNGDSELKSMFTELCDLSFDLSFNEFDAFISENSSYTISDFGFKVLYD